MSSPVPSHSPSPTAGTTATTLTTPDQSPGADSDIWDTSTSPPFLPANPNHLQHDTSDATMLVSPGATSPNPAADDGAHVVQRTDILSDLPALRRQHMTDGYREGLSIGKARVMQDGFDAGYPVGVDLGLRVGTVLGVLEGVVAALERRGSANASASANPTTRSADVEALKRLYESARSELAVPELLRGVDDETIDTVVDRAPAHVEEVVRRWEGLVAPLLRARGASDANDHASTNTNTNAHGAGDGERKQAS